MKSQLYASIGIMAGSITHNIKNLLVRPNDLLVRCIEADGMYKPRNIREVKSTLGTVTDRLQQILRTVRDPGDTELIVNLAALSATPATTWAEIHGQVEGDRHVPTFRRRLRSTGTCRTFNRP